MSIKYSTDNDDIAMKTPILAQIYYALGWITVAATVLIITTGAVIPDDKVKLPIILIVAGCGGFLALFQFGVAQLITIFAKIEYNTRRVENDAHLRTLHHIEGHLEALRKK
jgi:hypothetical protein